MGFVQVLVHLTAAGLGHTVMSNLPPRADIPDPPTRPPVKLPKSLKFTAMTESQVKFVPHKGVQPAKLLRPQHHVQSRHFEGRSEHAEAFGWTRTGFLLAKQKKAMGASITHDLRLPPQVVCDVCGRTQVGSMARYRLKS